MYCVDKAGNEVWSLKTNMMIWSSPAFFSQSNLMVFGSLDRHLYVVNYETGKLVQKINLGSEVKSSPAIEGDDVFVGHSGGMFLKFRLTEGRLQRIWDFPVNGEIYSSPLVIDNYVVFGSLNGFVYGLNKFNGNKTWDFIHILQFQVLLLERKMALSFLAQRRKLYALDAKSGERIWSFKTSNKQYKVNLDSSPMITDSGSIVVGSYNGNIPCPL